MITINKNIKLAQALVKNLLTKEFLLDNVLPTVVGGLYGGAVADKLQRDEIIPKNDILTRAAIIAGSAIGRHINKTIKTSPYELEYKLLGLAGLYPALYPILTSTQFGKNNR